MGNFQIKKLYLIVGSILFVSAIIIGIFWFLFQPTAGKKAVISGIFSISGQVPQGSTITLFARDITGGNTFIPVTNGLPAKDLSPWQFTTGIPGKSYEIKAQMTINGQPIDSNSITAIVPSLNQILVFPSTTSVSPTAAPQIIASPTPTPYNLSIPTPTPTILIPTPPITPSPSASPSAGASISGTLTFTGQPPVSSRVVIFQRVTGTTNYQVAVDNFIPLPSSVWIWQGGTQGTSYDFVAILKQHQTNGTDIDIASSNTISLTAPSTTGALSMTYSSTLATPGPNISVTCNTLDGPSQTWNASVAFQTVTGAASYWFEIGTTDGGIDLLNSTMNAVSGNSQILSEPFKNGTTYYAKYAYAGIPNINSGASQFSPLSSSAQLKCQ